jgi:hypothetical protein
MSMSIDAWKTEIDWPAEGYRERGSDETHAWTDLVPDEDGEVHPDQPYTYQDLVGDQAEAAHMTVAEFLGSLRYNLTPAADELDELLVDDEDLYE